MQRASSTREDPQRIGAGSRRGRSTMLSDVIDEHRARGRSAAFAQPVATRPCAAVFRKQTVALRPATRRLSAVRDVDLPVDVRQVEFHRLLGYPEHPGDLRVGVSSATSRRISKLAAGQARRVVHFSASAAVADATVRRPAR